MNKANWFAATLILTTLIGGPILSQEINSMDVYASTKSPTTPTVMLQLHFGTFNVSHNPTPRVASPVTDPKPTNSTQTVHDPVPPVLNIELHDHSGRDHCSPKKKC